MEIKIYVVGQTLKVATIPYEFIDGSQNFVAFKFHLDSQWDELRPFAQFIQDEVAYNVYLDENGVCYLPPEIVEGTFLLLLYGAAGDVRATTNFLEFTVKHNILIGDAQSIEITQSLYDQLVNKVNKVLDDITNSGIDDLVKVQVGQIVADYVNQGRIANLVIGNGSIEKAKLASSVQASLNKADNSWQKSTSTGSTSPTSGSWEATYDTHKNATDVFDYAANQSKTAIGRLRNIATGNVPDGTQIFTVGDQSYSGIDAALNGIASLAGSSSPISIEVVSLRPEIGNDLTFYLIPKGNGKYEKWWYIDNGTGTKVWDSFGSSSTEVVNTLPNNPSPDVDYILNTNGEYTYYKYINDGWRMIAGSGSVVLTNNNDGSIKVFGVGNPSNALLADLAVGNKYLNTNNFQVFTVTGNNTNKSWSSGSGIVDSYSANKDYYIKDPSGNWAHFRYINSKFERVGMDAYTRTEVDNLISGVEADIEGVAASMSNLGNLVSDVTRNEDNLQVSYKDGSSKNIDISDTRDLVATISPLEDNSGIHVVYTNEDFVDIQLAGGGGGGGGAANAYVTRIGNANIQTIYGNDCYIQFKYTALDASGEDAGNGDYSVYVGGILRATGTAYSNEVVNSVNVGPYLSVGDNNTVRIVVTKTIDDVVSSSSKSWNVNAINMYLEWNYIDTIINSGNTFTLRWTPHGGLSKTTHIVIDGTEVASPTTTREVEQTLTLPSLTHGSHLVYMYLTASVGATPITTDRIYHDMIFDRGGDNTIISCSIGNIDIMQYNTVQIPVIVYNPNSLTSTVVFGIDGEYYTTWNDIDRTKHDWNFSPNDVGNTVTYVGTSLPSTGTENTDFYLNNNGTFTHYKRVDGAWAQIGVENVELINYASGVTITESGVGEPILDVNSNHNKYYLRTDTLTLYHCAIPDGGNEYIWISETSLVDIPSITKIYFAKDETNNYVRFKYIEGSFVQMGTKVLSISSGGIIKHLFANVSQLNINNEEVPGYVFRLKASDISGNDALRAWESNGVTATFSNNFDWNNGGIKSEVDDDGHIRQYICIKAGTTMTINHKLFADDPTMFGKTFKIIFKSKNVRDYDAMVASCFADNIGLQMTANETTFRSSGTTISVPYGEDEYTELEFDIYPAPNGNNNSFRYIMAWADGVITSCRVYGQSDNFTQTAQNQQYITIGSNDCDVYIYLVKVYPTYISRENHIVNFIADAPNAQEMIQRYNRNDILDASGEINYEKLAEKNPDCRVWLYDIPQMTISKKDKISNCVFNQFWKNGSNYYNLSGIGTLTVQGTSSVDYLLGAANTDIDFTSLMDGYHNDLLENGVVEKKKYGNNYYVGNTETGKVTVFDVDENTVLTNDCVPVERDANGNVTKYIKALGYKVNDDSCPISYSNTKINFASCEQVNNMCNAAWYQRFQPYQSMTKRDCMEFSMGVQFIKDSGNVSDDQHFVLFGDDKYHMYSIGNMGTSKKNVHLFHDLSNPNEACIEVGNNLDDLCRMVDDDLSDLLWFGGSSKSCECRYPDTDTPPQNIIDGWQRFVTWMKNSNPGAATGNQLSSPETYGQYTFRGHDRPGEQVLRGTRVTQYAGTYTHDTFERRMAKMLSECEDYMVMDSVVYHFVYLERHTMVDNVAKNTFWSSSDLLHWDLSKAYDMDTSDGNNNEGKLVLDYGNEADDVIGTKSVFNANDAVWFVFISNLYEACQTMFINRETAGAWSASSYHQFLLSEQRKVPERVWVQCYWYDYLRTYERGINTEWMLFLDGGQKTHQRWHYEYYEEIYDSSKYRGASCTVQNVNFRGYYPGRWAGLTNEQWNALRPKAEIQLKMYNKCYINVSIDGTIYSQKADKGNYYTIDFSRQQKLNDTVINIYSASMIQEIGDMSRLYPGTVNFANATRLRSLTIGSSTEAYRNSNLESVTLGNNSMLEYLYVQNLAYIEGGLDLSRCQSLVYLDASGSSFTAYDFAVGGLLNTAYIQSPTSLTLRDLYYITDETLHIYDFSRLDTLRIESCAQIDSLSIVNTAASLSRLRLVNINWIIPTTTTLNRLLTILGLDENGYGTSKSILTGQVYVSGRIRNQEIYNYETTWPNLTVSYEDYNIVSQSHVYFLNDDDEQTVLYDYFVDYGSTPQDPVVEGWIPAPTKAQNQQYIYTFSGWSENINNDVYTDTTIITAVYTTETRTYTVRFFTQRGASPVEVHNNVAFGSEVVFEGDIPTDTSGEISRQYKLFKGWNKSTGFIREDLDVYAIWEVASGLPTPGTPMDQLTPTQIYSICQTNMQDDYGWTPLDYTEIVMGHDFDFENVPSIEFGTDVPLTGIPTDPYISGGYVFDGETAYTTDVVLFGEDSPSFTMAIDFQFSDVTPNQTILTNQEDGQSLGFRIYVHNGYPAVSFGGSSDTCYLSQYTFRTMAVLQYTKGSSYISVYCADAFRYGVTTNYQLLATEVHRSGLFHGTSPVSNAPLTFGASKNFNGYRNYAKGVVHWCKIWFDDLGENVCRELALWPRQKLRMEYWGKQKYLYAGTNAPCKASFVCNTLLGDRYFNGTSTYLRGFIMKMENISTTPGTYSWANTNVGGWEESWLRGLLNNRFFNSFPYEWQSIIRAVEIKASVGGQDSGIYPSSDKVYIPSLREMGSGTTVTAYYQEVGTSVDPITWFASAYNRSKAPGILRKYNGDESIDQLYTGTTEPSIANQTSIKPYSVWYNSSVYLIFLPQEYLDIYGIIPNYVVDNAYAQGGWVTCVNYWERSAYISSSYSFWYINGSASTGNTAGSGSVMYILPCFSL